MFQKALVFLLVMIALLHSLYGKEIGEPPSPWFIGTLLSDPGETLPAGHTNWEPYLFVTDNIGVYNYKGKHSEAPKSQTISPTLVVSHGVTRFMDVKLSAPIIHNRQQGQHDTRIGDIAFTLGFQAMREKRKTWRPSLRIALQEAFPTGHYDHLNPKKNGTDASGSGSWETSIGFNFQKLFLIWNRYLRVRFNLIGTFAANVHVEDLNVYGGGFGTNGKVKMGKRHTILLGTEFAFTRHWVGALDILHIKADKKTFSGNHGTTPLGEKASVGARSLSQLSLAPAIEYNFNANLGMIAGVWFTVRGRDAADFISGVIAVNYFH